MNENNSSGGIEGSQISFYCHDKRNESVVAICMKNGSWSPDPHTYNCQNDEEKDITSMKNNKTNKELCIYINIGIACMGVPMKVLSWVHYCTFTWWV